MIELTAKAATLSNDELDLAMAAEERRMVVADETETSMWLLALTREQRRRIAAGRAIVCAEPTVEPTGWQPVRHPVGARVVVCLGHGYAGRQHRATVVGHDGDSHVVTYRQVNGRIVTRTMATGVTAVEE